MVPENDKSVHSWTPYETEREKEKMKKIDEKISFNNKKLYFDYAAYNVKNIIIPEKYKNASNITIYSEIGNCNFYFYNYLFNILPNIEILTILVRGYPFEDYLRADFNSERNIREIKKLGKLRKIKFKISKQYEKNYIKNKNKYNVKLANINTKLIFDYKLHENCIYWLDNIGFYYVNNKYLRKSKNNILKNNYKYYNKNNNFYQCNYINKYINTKDINKYKYLKKYYITQPIRRIYNNLNKKRFKINIQYNSYNNISININIIDIYNINKLLNIKKKINIIYIYYSDIYNFNELYNKYISNKNSNFNKIIIELFNISYYNLYDNSININFIDNNNLECNITNIIHNNIQINNIISPDNYINLKVNNKQYNNKHIFINKYNDYYLYNNHNVPQQLYYDNRGNYIINDIEVYDVIYNFN
jgi:hypothetical protein